MSAEYSTWFFYPILIFCVCVGCLASPPRKEGLIIVITVVAVKKSFLASFTNQPDQADTPNAKCEFSLRTKSSLARGCSWRSIH